MTLIHKYLPCGCQKSLMSVTLVMFFCRNSFLEGISTSVTRAGVLSASGDQNASLFADGDQWNSLTPSALRDLT